MNERVVVTFTLPSNGERWHWPLEGRDAIAAFCELLDRANVEWFTRDTSAPVVSGEET